LLTPPVWLALAGVAVAWYLYMKNDDLVYWFYDHFRWLHRLLDKKYYFDTFNQRVFADGAIYLGNGLSTLAEKLLIDGLIVNSVARLIGFGAGIVSRIQTGYLYHYAFAMVIGLALLVAWFFVLVML
ncbi:MAG: NADH-quinone oxidoreductase subunit L, partial [Thiolinea sp.]